MARKAWWLTLLVALCLAFVAVEMWRFRSEEESSSSSSHPQQLPPSTELAYSDEDEFPEAESSSLLHDDDDSNTTSAANDDVTLYAPRSHSGAYNDRQLDRKYMIYSPGGGFSNQRKEIEYAIVIANLLNRTLYVPMCARHTNNWYNYAKLTTAGSDLFPMDRILDFPFLSQAPPGQSPVNLVPLNITVNQLVHQLFDSDTEVFRVERFGHMYERADVVPLRRIPHALLYFRGHGFYHPWFSDSTLLPVQRRTRFTAHIRQLAVAIVRDAFPHKFNAMHVRMGDYSWKYEGKDGSSLVRKIKDTNGWDLALPTYVATEPKRDDGFFLPLERGLQKGGGVRYGNQLPKHLVTKFTDAFPSGRIRGDMLGILEQLVCAQAKLFVGSYYSTYSKYISFTRQHLDTLFPEALVSK